MAKYKRTKRGCIFFRLLFYNSCVSINNPCALITKGAVIYQLEYISNIWCSGCIVCLNFIHFNFPAFWDVIHGGGIYLRIYPHFRHQHLIWLCIQEICCQKQMILRQTKCTTRNLKLASSNIHCLTEVNFYSSVDRWHFAWNLTIFGKNQL